MAYYILLFFFIKERQKKQTFCKKKKILNDEHDFILFFIHIPIAFSNVVAFLKSFVQFDFVFVFFSFFLRLGKFRCVPLSSRAFYLFWFFSIDVHGEKKTHARHSTEICILSILNVM